jgi:hypothetical protein
MTFGIFQFIKYISLIISILLVIRMVRKYRRIRAVSKKNCLIGIVFPILILLVYSVIIGTSLPPVFLFLLFGLGLILGLIQGQKTKVWIENRLPRARNTVWFLVIWALSYALTHVLMVAGSAMSMNVGIGTMSLTTAVALGTQGIILVRLSRLKASLQSPNAEADRASPPVKSTASLSGFRGRVHYCSRCGSKVFQRDRFCRSCGGVLHEGE